MRRAIRVEWWKVRRSRVSVTATVLLAAFVPGMGLSFYLVARTGGTGAIALKAAALLNGEGWSGYLGLVDQIAAVAVFIGVGVVVAWAFGREYTDRTFSSLFALPVPRSTIASAKFVVLAGWASAIAVGVTVGALALGVFAGVGSDGVPVLLADVVKLTVISVGAGALGLTMGLIASVGRGYLPAIGGLIVLVAVAQIAVLFGTGGWFPFAVPGLAAISGMPGAPTLILLQIVLVPLVVLVTVVITIEWWRRAEVV